MPVENVPFEKLLLWTTGVGVVLMATSLAVQAWVGLALMLELRTNLGKAKQLMAEWTKVLKSGQQLLGDAKPVVGGLTTEVKAIAMDAGRRGAAMRDLVDGSLAPARRSRDRARLLFGRKTRD